MAGERTVIGKLAQMSQDDAKKVLKAAKTAWGAGRGTWPQLSAAERIAAIENVVKVSQW